jgi:phosphatidylglycerophosphatase C
VAVFDLDGTITRRDTLFPYVFGYLLHHPLRLPRLFGVLSTALAFLLGRADHGALKSAFIRSTLGGASRDEIERWTAQFVEQLIRSGVLKDALTHIRRHRDAGDFLVLLSASTDLYVPDIGRLLGFAQVVCTRVEWQEDKLIGRLTTPNRRGQEKVHCLAWLRTRHPRQLIAAYGNARSDLEHLRMAERPVLVNGSRRTRKAAARYGIPHESWH